MTTYDLFDFAAALARFQAESAQQPPVSLSLLARSVTHSDGSKTCTREELQRRIGN